MSPAGVPAGAGLSAWAIEVSVPGMKCQLTARRRWQRQASPSKPVAGKAASCSIMQREGSGSAGAEDYMAAMTTHVIFASQLSLSAQSQRCGPCRQHGCHPTRLCPWKGRPRCTHAHRSSGSVNMHNAKGRYYCVSRNSAGAGCLIEEAQNLATGVLAAGLLVVHDAEGGGEHNLAELLRRDGSTHTTFQPRRSSTSQRRSTHIDTTKPT